jgi:predicted metal-dependent hydrolase
MPSANLALPNGENLPLIVRINPRARRILMRLDPVSRTAIVTSPSKWGVSEAIAFAQGNGAWAQEKLSALPVRSQFSAGECIPLRGGIVVIRRVDSRTRPVLRDGVLTIGCHNDDLSDRVRRTLIGFAREDIKQSVGRHAAALGVKPRSIALKDTRARWGSCSAKGNLNFSWRLVFAPPFVLDYVAAHEVCHLKEMNHGPLFWSHVQTLFGDHKAARDWLRQNGARIQALGRAKD